jgi:hypothetical protein
VKSDRYERKNPFKTPLWFFVWGFLYGVKTNRKENTMSTIQPIIDRIMANRRARREEELAEVREELWAGEREYEEFVHNCRYYEMCEAAATLNNACVECYNDMLEKNYQPPKPTMTPEEMDRVAKEWEEDDDLPF